MGIPFTGSCIQTVSVPFIYLFIYNLNIIIMKQHGIAIIQAHNTANLHLPMTQRVIISYQNDEDLASKALALALTRTMLSLPYSPDTAEDLGQAV